MALAEAQLRLPNQVQGLGGKDHLLQTPGLIIMQAIVRGAGTLAHLFRKVEQFK